MTDIPLFTDEIPYLTTQQMIEVDRAMIEDYGIQLIQMMENAGRNLAQLARQRFLGGDPRGKRVIVLAGTGGNGGGAMVAARRLHNYGASVRVFITKPDAEMTPVPAQQLMILRRMNIPIMLADALPYGESVDVILDGVIGYRLNGAPKNRAGAAIRWANLSGVPVLSLDVPSGIDTTTGKAYDPAIRASATLTLALPKIGLQAEVVRDHIGELYVADISVPPPLYRQPPLNLQVGAVFAQGDIVQLW